MLNEVKIAISGKSGCGNSTVSRLVAEKLSLKLINYTFKDMAREMGIEFAELCRLAEMDNDYDKKLDQHQIALAAQAGIVLGSRLAIWLLENADLKVFLYASPEVRAGRIASREGLEYAAALDDMTKRDMRDRKRYIRLYDIDIDEHSFADMIIDASIDQYAIANSIIDEIKKS